MVMMFMGGVVLMLDSGTIPTLGNLRGESFSFQPEPLLVKLLSLLCPNHLTPELALYGSSANRYCRPLSNLTLFLMTEGKISNLLIYTHSKLLSLQWSNMIKWMI
jgi:hypothetical protein